jgi:hypothetical protein
MLSIFTKALLVALLTGNLGGMSWCPQESAGQARLLYNASGNGRICEDVWEAWWKIDQPTHLVPIRVHGGIGP